MDRVAASAVAALFVDPETDAPFPNPFRKGHENGPSDDL
jgi:hypothetical protein